MRLLNLLILFSFLFFVFLGGYAVSLWLPPQGLLLPESANLTIPVIFDSVSDGTLVVSTLAKSPQLLEFELDKDVKVRSLIQKRQGEIREEPILIEYLKKGDNLLIEAVVLQDDTKRIVNIDKFVKEP